MLSRISILLAFILLATCASAQDTSLIKYRSIFQHQLRLWTRSFSDFNVAGFKLQKKFGFDETPYGDMNRLKSFYSIYKPLLSFSDDSTRFIDIYSYWLNLRKEDDKLKADVEVDQAITLCEIPFKKWTQIFFCGFSIRIDEAIWIAKDRFMLAGTIKGDSSDANHPTIFIGDLYNRQLYHYIDKNSESLPSGYNSPRLKRLKIED